jgi:hypothetical protein
MWETKRKRFIVWFIAGLMSYGTIYGILKIWVNGQVAGIFEVIAIISECVIIAWWGAKVRKEYQKWRKLNPIQNASHPQSVNSQNSEKSEK